MKALQIHAGPAALAHIKSNGLKPQDISVIPGAAGGPKGLVLGPIDRYLFDQWLPRSNQPIDLVGASIGAWPLRVCQTRVPSCWPLKKLMFTRITSWPPGKADPLLNKSVMISPPTCTGFTTSVFTKCCSIRATVCM